MTFLGGLPEPRGRDHRFRRHRFQERWFARAPGFSPGNPRGGPEQKAEVLILFLELSSGAKEGGVAKHW
jgi:hypothetical protein